MKRAITDTHTIKLANAMAELKCQCKRCGHKEVIPVQQDSKVCSYCGYRIQNDSKLYFSYRLRRMIKNGERKGYYQEEEKEKEKQKTKNVRPMC